MGVPVVRVGHVGVRVGQWRVPVRVHMRPGGVQARGMRVLVMCVVDVRVRVRERIVAVLMRVAEAAAEVGIDDPTALARALVEAGIVA